MDRSSSAEQISGDTFTVAPVARTAGENLPVDELDAVLRCRAGDRNAFRLIVERYGDLLFGTAYSMLGDRALAEEHVQDALVAAWKGLDSFDAKRPLRPWLLRVLVNRVMQHRRRKLLWFIPLAGDVTQLPAYDHGPEQVIEVQGLREEIHSALGELRPDEYRVIVLKYYAELPVNEIAFALELPEGTVKSQLYRARQRLRGILTRSGFSFEEDQS